MSASSWLWMSALRTATKVRKLRSIQIIASKAIEYDSFPFPHASGSAPRAFLRRGGEYVGISVSKFDELVAAGRMPPPRVIDRRKVWDIRSIDAAFDELPYENSPAVQADDDDWKTAV
jgi:predicted DNA-binding transcriptional regulator AlpA